MPHYIDAFTVPVPTKKLARYKRLATAAAKLWMKHGALQYIECMGEDLHNTGPMMPFPKLLKCKPDETVIFSWILYRSRKHRDQVNKKVLADPRMTKLYEEQVKDPPFNEKRLAYGGFKTIVEKR